MKCDCCKKNTVVTTYIMPLEYMQETPTGYRQAYGDKKVSLCPDCKKIIGNLLRNAMLSDGGDDLF